MKLFYQSNMKIDIFGLVNLLLLFELDLSTKFFFFHFHIMPNLLFNRSYAANPRKDPFCLAFYFLFFEIGVNGSRVLPGALGWKTFRTVKIGDWALSIDLGAVKQPVFLLGIFRCLLSRGYLVFFAGLAQPGQPLLSHSVCVILIAVAAFVMVRLEKLADWRLVFTERLLKTKWYEALPFWDLLGLWHYKLYFNIKLINRRYHSHCLY